MESYEIDLSKTIKDYMDEFNGVLNATEFEPDISAADLKYYAIRTLKNAFEKLNISDPYTNSKSFFIILNQAWKVDKQFRLNCTEQEAIGIVDFEIRLEFKISVKRSDKTVVISPTRSRYLNYIDKNPTKFLSCHDTVLNIPTYGWNDSGKINNDGCITKFSSMKIKSSYTIQDIIDKATEIVQSDKIMREIKKQICKPVAERAFLDKNYDNLINFTSRFESPITGIVQIDDLYDFIVSSNILETKAY